METRKLTLLDHIIAFLERIRYKYYILPENSRHHNEIYNKWLQEVHPELADSLIKPDRYGYR